MTVAGSQNQSLGDFGPGLEARDVASHPDTDLSLRSSRHNDWVVSPAIDNLVAQLTRLPGVGSRTAHRLAFHLLRAPRDEALELAGALTNARERVRFCAECGNWTEEETCEICLDARRDRTLICVVEQPADVLSLER